MSAFGHAWGLGAAGNPLTKQMPGEEGTYENINRDSGEFLILFSWVVFECVFGRSSSGAGDVCINGFGVCSDPSVCVYLGRRYIPPARSCSVHRIKTCGRGCNRARGAC